MELKNNLSHRDLTSLLTISHDCLRCRDTQMLKRLVADLKKLIGFEYAVFAQAKFPDLFDDPQATVEVLNISYPVVYLDEYLQERLHLSDATVCAFLANLEPVHWKRVDERCETLYPAARLSLECGMIDGWTHGILETGAMTCTQFAAGWPHEEKDPRTGEMIDYIVPFLTDAYQRILDGRKPQAAIRLTPREREVLKWLKEGKGSWEISMILRCSRRVVDFHVANVKKKLNCASRAQAIAVALHGGLIEF